MGDSGPSDLAGGPHTGGTSTRIAVGIITYRRPALLRRCLETLAHVASPRDAEVEVLVVDNDKDGSAEGVVKEVGEFLQWPLRYVVESEKGIPFARNRLVREALDLDLVAFIDDDQLADPSWLQELLETWRRTGADIVQGVAPPKFDDGVPAWVKDGRFFDRTVSRTGRERLTEARSGNVLVSTEIFRSEPVWFDPIFWRSGGSDAEFFRRVLQKGRWGTWARGAVAEERIGADRASVMWIVRRAYRTGTVSAYTEFRREPSLRAAMRQITEIIAELAKGVWRGLRSGGGAEVLVVHVLQSGARCAGRLAGMLGRLYPEYDPKG